MELVKCIRFKANCIYWFHFWGTIWCSAGSSLAEINRSYIDNNVRINSIIQCTFHFGEHFGTPVDPFSENKTVFTETTHCISDRGSSDIYLEFAPHWTYKSGTVANWKDLLNDAYESYYSSLVVKTSEPSVVRVYNHSDVNNDEKEHSWLLLLLEIPTTWNQQIL